MFGFVEVKRVVGEARGLALFLQVHDDAVVKRVWIGIVIVFAAVASVVFWQVVVSSAEPVYKGKTLTQWLEQLVADEVQGGRLRVTAEQRDEARAAIRQIGAKAAPTLLHLCRAKDSTLKRRLMGWLARRHLTSVGFRPAVERNFAAYAGFMLLGTNAQGAVPGLIQVVSGHSSLDSKCCAIFSLRAIGPAAQQAVPCLLQCSSNAAFRPYALAALLHISPKVDAWAGGEPVFNGMPLIWWLVSCDEIVGKPDTGQCSAMGKDGQSSIEAITQVGTNAIPSLLRLLRLEDSPFMDFIDEGRTIAAPPRVWRRRALTALEVLGTNAATAVPALMEIAREGVSGDSRQCAIEAIGFMGPRAKEAVPALMQWMTNHDEVAIRALGNIGPAAKPAVPWLLQHVGITDGSRYVAEARRALRLIDPQAATKAGTTDQP